MSDSDNVQTNNKRQFDAIVCYNKQIRCRYYCLGLEFYHEAAMVFSKFRPGQFAQIDLSSAAIPKIEKIPEDLADSSKRNIILRRPFSFCNLTTDKNRTTAEILYCTIGPATLRMTNLSAGNKVNIIGPLGNGFSIPEGKKQALLVAGGMGVPPLLHLAKVLNAEHGDMISTAFVGAKSKQDLPFAGQIDGISEEIGFPIQEFSRYGIESAIATDNGSLGHHGTVTQSLLQWLDKEQPKPEETIIYTCGPEPMLAKVAEIAKNKNIDCQVSMERRMACGIGICQSCAIECKVDDSDETIYKMCCKDGPVFDAKKVVF